MVVEMRSELELTQCRVKPQTLFKKTSTKNLESTKGSDALVFEDIPKRDANEGDTEA